MPKLIPVNKQIILKIMNAEDTLRNGIFIPATMKEKPQEGTVFASDHEDYKPGDVVLYRKFSGFEFTIDEVQYLVIESNDVLVKLEEGA